MKSSTRILLLALGGFDFPVSGGEFYQQFLSTIGTNEGCVWIGESPLLVDTNNNGAKLGGATINLATLKETGAISGVRLGMTMDEAVGHWGKPRGGYGPVGCLHGLTTFFYDDVALAFQGDRLETVQFSPSRQLVAGLWQSSKPDDLIRGLGAPTSRRISGRYCNLVYLSSGANLRLDFREDELVNVWLERTPSRAEPWNQSAGAIPKGRANGKRPFGSETNRTPTAVAPRGSP